MKKASIGTWVTTYNVAAVDVMSKCGFDWVCIDLEHTSINLDQLQNLLNVLDKNNTFSFVRVSENNKTEIKKVLDLGAKGIVIPMVNTASQARNAISYVNYPLKGERGFGLARAQGYGYEVKKYEKISKSIKIVLQIESIQGINNFNEIVKVKGFHSTLIGPRDLSGSLGIVGDYKSKKFLSCLKKYENICKKNKVTMGMHIAYPDINVANLNIKKGYKFFAIGTDMTFLGNSCLESLKKIKK